MLPFYKVLDKTTVPPLKQTLHKAFWLAHPIATNHLLL
jgi:hypothetical protein